MATLQQLIEKAGQVAVLKAHPVGSYFITEEDRNPAEILGLGGVSTWVKLEGRVLLGASSTYPVGSEGGEANVKLTIANMPSHKHFDIAYSEAKGQYSASVPRLIYRDGSSATTSWITTPTEFGAQSNGGDQAHNNLQPYRSAFIWRRTA